MCPKIKKDAIFIADAHENEQRRHLWTFLCEVEKGAIKPSQLFLMGDMFDLLVGEISSTHAFARAYIDKIEKLASRMEVFYFEGNHDFRLKKLFKKVKVYKYSAQPVIFESEDGKALLSHGDRFENIFYKFYTLFIRNFCTLKLLNLLDRLLNGKISAKIIASQKHKNICMKIEDFEKKIALKLLKYDLRGIKYVLEGHYHQNKEFKLRDVKYKNFSSFACDKSYFVVQSAQGMKFTQLKIRGSNGNNI